MFKNILRVFKKKHRERPSINYNVVLSTDRADDEDDFLRNLSGGSVLLADKKGRIIVPPLLPAIAASTLRAYQEKGILHHYHIRSKENPVLWVITFSEENIDRLLHQFQLKKTNNIQSNLENIFMSIENTGGHITVESKSKKEITLYLDDIGMNIIKSIHENRAKHTPQRHRPQ